MIRSKPRTRRTAGALVLAGASAFSAPPSAGAHALRHATKVAATANEAPFSVQASRDAAGSASYAHDSWHAARLARWGETYANTAGIGVSPKRAARNRVRSRTEPELRVALLAALAAALFVLQRRQDH